MGNGSRYTAETVTLRPSQRKRFDTSYTTRTVIGGFDKITYKEVIDGITYIRTKWRRKKNKERRRRS